MKYIENVRNFCIIAHIDHGKSTLADRLLEHTGTVAQRDMQNQILDSMDIERERGITIKLNAARMNYKAEDGKEYILNLIDTPGHVDFSYEVSRSLAACEGALLIVDATQGVEAQTLANVYLAVEQNLEIIPVINKIDLPSADVERVKQEIEDVLGIDASMAIPVSAKEGIGIKEVLESVVNFIPPPEDTSDKPLRALVFDSAYDQYLGTLCFFKVVDGSIKLGDTVKFMASGKEYEVVELGYQTPRRVSVNELKTGDVGYFAGSIKELTRFVGDTITNKNEPANEPLAGYKEVSFEVLNGYNFLLGTRLGFWDDMCREEMPASRFLVQTDQFTMEELIRESSLPCFVTDVAEYDEEIYGDRIVIPVSDQAAKITFHIVYNGTDKKYAPAFAQLFNF